MQVIYHIRPSLHGLAGKMPFFFSVASLHFSLHSSHQLPATRPNHPPVSSHLRLPYPISGESGGNSLGRTTNLGIIAFSKKGIFPSLESPLSWCSCALAGPSHSPVIFFGPASCNLKPQTDRNAVLPKSILLEAVTTPPEPVKGISRRLRKRIRNSKAAWSRYRSHKSREFPAHRE